MIHFYPFSLLYSFFRCGFTSITWNGDKIIGAKSSRSWGILNKSNKCTVKIIQNENNKLKADVKFLMDLRTTTSTTTTTTTTTTTKATISSIQINVFASQKFSQGCPSLKSSLCSGERSLEQLRSIIKISNSALS